MKRNIRIVGLTAALLISSLGMIRCGSGAPNPISLLNGIVKAAEAAIPLIQGISVADQGLVNTYLNAGLTITDGLISCGASLACADTAIGQFNALVLPTLSTQAPAAVVSAIQIVAVAIQAFVDAYTPLPPPGVSVRAGRHPRGAKYKLSASDEAKLADLRGRIKALRAQLH